MERGQQQLSANIEDDALEPAELARVVGALLADDPRRAAMAAASRSLARPDAAKRIAGIVRALRWKGPWFQVSAISGDGCRTVCAEAYRFITTGKERAPRSRSGAARTPALS